MQSAHWPDADQTQMDGACGQPTTAKNLIESTESGSWGELRTSLEHGDSHSYRCDDNTSAGDEHGHQPRIARIELFG